MLKYLRVLIIGLWTEAFLNGSSPASFSVFFKQTLQWKKSHPVYGAGILTHNLQDVSFLSHNH